MGRHRGGSSSSGDLLARFVISELFKSTHKCNWRIGNDINKCSLCGKCENVCHAGALSVSRHNGTWKLNNRICNHCLSCVMACPKRCLMQVSL